MECGAGIAIETEIKPALVAAPARRGPSMNFQRLGNFHQ